MALPRNSTRRRASASPNWAARPAGGQAGQLAPQSLDFRRPVQSQHTSEALRRILFEIFRTFDAPQRHQQQREQTGAQSIEARAETAVDFLRALEHPTGHQNRQRQENAGSRNCARRTEQRRRVLQQSQPRQQVGRRNDHSDRCHGWRRLVGAANAKSGQFWVRVGFGTPRAAFPSARAVLSIPSG